MSVTQIFTNCHTLLYIELDNILIQSTFASNELIPAYATFENFTQNMLINKRGVGNTFPTPLFIQDILIVKYLGINNR